MKVFDLYKINKLYFGYEEISRVLGISMASARVSASRYVRHGALIRVKRNMYMLKERWNRLNRREMFQIANLIQVPSYISLMSAMDYYEITTQLQQNFFESIALKKTKQLEIKGNVFNYSKIKQNLYFGFLKEKDFFISTPEKAFLDSLYLKSLGRYNFDISSIDFTKLDLIDLKEMAEKFPDKISRMVEQGEYFTSA